tara:strand:- start:165 stop:701 length:537 start_codon:yes stop_codon:yes gene_type:complete
MIIQQPTITASISGDNIKSNPQGTYIGFNASSSISATTNEVVLGINVTGSGNNTVTLGNEDTTLTKIFGSIYKHQKLIGNKFTTHNLEKFYVYTMSGSFTASLPPSPISGDSIKLSNLSTTQTGSDRGEITSSAARILISRNGNNIMGYSEDMQLDYFSPSFELIYTEPTDGWVIISS